MSITGPASFPPIGSPSRALPELALPAAALRRTALFDLHSALEAKLVPFAGYEMPLHYTAGIVKEHLHVRSAAGLFDVSHMGQARIEGANFEAIACALEAIVPADILSLQPGRLRYTQLLNDEGGIVDDMIVSRLSDDGTLGIVVNASRKEAAFKRLSACLPSDVRLVEEPEFALLALQGPASAAVLAKLIPGVEHLNFMSGGRFAAGGGILAVSRTGYTGEDGFEIAIPANRAEAFARRILAGTGVLPIGLGARDTLRLEAGLGLYGQDMTEATSPVEAGLAFSIGKRRRQDGGFPGASRIEREFRDGTAKLRVGLKLEGRAAARTGMAIVDEAGAMAGQVTSGAFTPTAATSIAMGYVSAPFSKPGTQVFVLIRGAPQPARVVTLPFVPHRYWRSR